MKCKSKFIFKLFSLSPAILASFTPFKVNVGFLFVPHMRFVSVAISVVIVRRIRQFVVGMKSRRLGKISAYEVSLSVIAILKFAGLPAG